jgi:anti-sigma regulatory factor (Ser/Thr protein kinase)
MAYTIARIAGKRATSGSPILMPTDSDHAAPAGPRAQVSRAAPAVRIVSTLHNDPRLLIGAAIIAGHTAQQAGFPEQAQEDLAAATTEACSEVFGLVRSGPKSPPVVNLTAARFPDRVEITVELSTAPAKPKASSRSKKTASGGTKRLGNLLDGRLVDHVQRETRDGRPSIMLVKYCRPVKSKV